MSAFWILFPLLAHVPSQTGEDASASTLLARVIEAQQRHQEAQRALAYRERTLTENLSKDGTVSRSESDTFVVTPTPSGEYRRLVARNGRPLSANDEAKELDKLDQHVKKLLRMSDAERARKANDKLDSRVERYRSRLEEALDAYDFEPLPDELIDGQRLRVFRFEPKPSYVGHSRPTKVLARMEGVVWIDARRDQLAKLSVAFTKDLKFLGGVFGRVSRGTKAVVAGTLVDGLWLPVAVDVSLDARLYFLKRYRQRIAIRYDDYRRYPADTRVTVTPKPGPSQR